MRVDRELTLKVFRKWGALETGEVPILMYHSIADNSESVAPYFRTSTSPDRFSQQMQWLTELGYVGVSLEEALDSRLKPENGKRFAAITFDDGFRDFYTSAWPVMQQHNFTATMYVPTAYISDSRKSWSGRECLDWMEVKSLRREGVRFGSHSVSHRTLYDIPWGEIEAELHESKDRLEQQLGEQVSSFAYPFAFPQEDRKFTRRFSEVVRACGYQSCVTTVVGRYQPGSDRFLIKRLPVNDCDDRALFDAKLAGAYDWMATPQVLVRRAKAFSPWRNRQEFEA